MISILAILSLTLLKSPVLLFQILRFRLVDIVVHESLLGVDSRYECVLFVVVILVRNEVFSVQFLLDVSHVAVPLYALVVNQLLVEQFFVGLLSLLFVVLQHLVHLLELRGLTAQRVPVHLIQVLLYVLQLLLLFDLSLHCLVNIPRCLLLLKFWLTLSLWDLVIVFHLHFLKFLVILHTLVVLRVYNILRIPLLFFLHFLIEPGEPLFMFWLPLNLSLHIFIHHLLLLFLLLLLQQLLELLHLVSVFNFLPQSIRILLLLLSLYLFQSFVFWLGLLGQLLPKHLL